MFERLRGAFGDQAIHDLYPKLLKRLDDSSDAVRSAICSTLDMFMQVSDRILPYYNNTALLQDCYNITRL